MAHHDELALGHPSIEPSWHTWASCSSAGDSPTSRHLGAHNGHISLKSPRHSTDTCPSVGDSPISYHLGAQRTLVSLPGTPQPFAIKALHPLLEVTHWPQAIMSTPRTLVARWGLTNVKPSHLARPGTANAGDCPIGGQRSQTLSALVPVCTPPTHLETLGNHTNTLCHSSWCGACPNCSRHTTQTSPSSSTCPSPPAPWRTRASTRLNSHKTSLLQTGSSCKVTTRDNCAHFRGGRHLRNLHGLHDLAQRPPVSKHCTRTNMIWCDLPLRHQSDVDKRAPNHSRQEPLPPRTTSPTPPKKNSGTTPLPLPSTGGHFGQKRSFPRFEIQI